MTRDALERERRGAAVKRVHRPHLLGIDDGPVTIRSDAPAVVVGVVMEGHDLVEAVAVTRFPVDGADATGFLADWVRALRARPGLQGIVLGGITIAGLGVVAGLFFSIAARQTGQPYLFILAAPLVGACLGFLPYNFRRDGARIFLGDAGASFIGFTLAGLAVMGEWAEDDPLVALLTPILILAVPLFDIAFVGVVRVATGKVHSLREWLAYAAKDHIHHRFEAVGLSKTQSVFLIYFIAATLGLSAILLKEATPREAALVLLQVACVLAIIAVLEGVGRGRPRQ